MNCHVFCWTSDVHWFSNKKNKIQKVRQTPHPLRVWNPLHHLIELPNWVLSMVICVWHIEPPTAPVPALAHVEGLQNFITKPILTKQLAASLEVSNQKFKIFCWQRGDFNLLSFIYILKKTAKTFGVGFVLQFGSRRNSWDVFSQNLGFPNMIEAAVAAPETFTKLQFLRC